MNEHGWFSVAKSASARPPAESSVDFETVFPNSSDDRLIGGGFRNFLGKPGPKETFRFKGRRVSRRNQRDLRKALAKLSYALERQLLNEPIGENPAIPSGYSYLMQ